MALKTADADAPGGASVRVFFALVPPASLQRTLALLGRDVARRAHGRALPADNLHVTAAFVGAWPPSRLAHWVDVGERCAGQAMHMTLDTLGGFGRAGVAWIGDRKPPAALIELGNALSSELSAAGVVVEPRPFRPHLTLARNCRASIPHARVGPYEWDVGALTLLQSQTLPDGARYAALRQWRLWS